MSILCRTFRIDPKSHALSRFFYSWSETKKLRWRIKHYMIRILKKFLKFICPITGTEYMNLFFRHFLSSKSCLKQSAGLCTRKIRLKKLITVIIAERFLRQQHLTSCLLCHFTEQFCIFYKCFFVQDIARCFYIPEFRRNDSAGGCKWCSFIQSFHQSTSFGSRLSLRGRP